jgi:hypothetical protein
MVVTLQPFLTIYLKVVYYFIEIYLQIRNFSEVRHIKYARYNETNSRSKEKEQ